MVKGHSVIASFFFPYCISRDLLIFAKENQEVAKGIADRYVCMYVCLYYNVSLGHPSKTRQNETTFCFIWMTST